VLINYRTTPDWSAAVLEGRHRRRSPPGGVEAGGGETGAGDQKSHLAWRPHLSVIGILSGFLAASFPLALVMGKNLTVGITKYKVSRTASTPCAGRSVSPAPPVIDQDLQISITPKMARTMKKQGHFGKIVIRSRTRSDVRNPVAAPPLRIDGSPERAGNAPRRCLR
jgi:hypothetical protein